MSLRINLWNAFRLAGSALAASAIGTSAMAAGPVTGHPLKDPHYGDVLFHFYQDHYFTSITSLMVSQNFNRIANHADEAELLRGGMLLSYGLHREAGEIFAQLIEKGAEPAVRDRAWFYLAKIRYQRGFLAEAEDAIGRIENNLPPELEEERVLLKANLLMARGDYAGAATVLNGLKTKTDAGLYARYNLGVALIKSGDIAGGSALLDALGTSPTPPVVKGQENPSTEEFRSLRDKANVALGFTALQNNNPEAARTYLERVRLTGMHANKALLGFGWAAASLKQPEKALAPWTELAERDPSDSAVLEARIAVPYAYAELKAFGQALDGYNEAIAAYDRERTGLDESIAAIRAGKLVDSLLDSNPGEEMGWFWNIRQFPDMPHASHLAQVLAQHEFQEAFKNLRDLQFLAKNLAQWQDNIGVFSDMLANRRQAFAERLPEIRKRAGESGLGALKQRAEALAADVSRAEADADEKAFADAKQRDMLDRLTRARTTLDAMGDTPEAATARNRFRLVSGALAWQLAQEFPDRLWDAKKSMQAIDTGLADAARADAALAQAQRDEPARFDAFAARIAELDPRIKALIPRVASLSEEQQKAVQELAVAELEHQKERLTSYTVQARFAAAQLYDRATQKEPLKEPQKEIDHAPKP
jgi:TolA-binding protein